MISEIYQSSREPQNATGGRRYVVSMDSVRDSSDLVMTERQSNMERGIVAQANPFMERKDRCQGAGTCIVGNLILITTPDLPAASTCFPVQSDSPGYCRYIINDRGPSSVWTKW